MSVSLLPLITSGLLVLLPLLFLLRGLTAFLRAAAASATLFLAIFLIVHVPGWLLMRGVQRNDPVAMYQLARWTESHAEKMRAVVLWSQPIDTDGGYSLLVRAAKLGHPPALYALGTRLKHGMFVPDPAKRSMPGIVPVTQQRRGQQFMDRAIRLGFTPKYTEQQHYFGEFRY